MEHTSGKILAQAMDETRNLTRFYAGKLKGVDMHREFEINGYKTNSPFWILAHLCWAEHMLLIECSGHDSLGIPWLNDFKIGSKKGADKSNWPPLEEVLGAMKQIHAEAMEKMAAMTEDQLDEDNELGLAFGENKSKRFMLMHAIRHEGTHCGQLSLIVKMYGKATV
ncbi:MAG: DinB family protein [Flavobacteriales bacterium]|nr:DinB family protein [Flavobacteriales bacterium]